MTGFCQLWLTCKDKAEADKVIKALLEKRLAVCVRQMPVSSAYWWQGEAQYKSAEPSVALAKEGKIEHAKEVLLMMESRTDLFEKVESEVEKLHSYNAFVLEAVPVSKISKKAHTWLDAELRNGT